MDPFVSDEILLQADSPTNGQLLSIAAGIQSQMRAMQQADHPFKDIVHPPTVIGFLLDLRKVGNIDVYVGPLGGVIGALGYTIEPLWWTTKKKCLVEQFVICLDPRYAGFGRVALGRLEEIAKQAQCAAIMTGNLLGTDPKRTENLYVRHGGFQFQYKHFIKVLKEVEQSGQ